MSGLYVVTRSGRRVALDFPSPQAIAIEDIAHHLSQLNRYSGAAELPWPVAAHSLLVMQLLRARGFDPLTCLQGLLHDAHEAYIGDIARPVALWLGLARIDALKEAFDGAIFAGLGVPRPCTQAALHIAAADDCALATEWRDLMPANEPCPVAHAPDPATLGQAGEWHDVRSDFLAAFAQARAALPDAPPAADDGTPELPQPIFPPLALGAPPSDDDGTPALPAWAQWAGEGEPPPFWHATDPSTGESTKIYRSIEDCRDG